MDYIKENEKDLKDCVFIDGGRDGYGVDSIASHTFTVKELIEKLNEFDKDLLICLRNDMGYTFGKINEYTIHQGTYDENTGESYIDESIENKLDEKIPSDLAKSYKNTVNSKTGKLLYPNNYGIRGREYMQNPDAINFENSDYKELTKEEAERVVKYGSYDDRSRLRFIVDGALVQFDKDGYQKYNNFSVSFKHIYTSKSGNKTLDTRKMPISHIVDIADKIYWTDEEEHKYVQGGPQVGEGEGDTGDHNDSTASYIPYPDADENGKYEKYNKTQEQDRIKRLNKLEKDYNNGNISKDKYERLKYNLEDDIKFYKDQGRKYRKIKMDTQKANLRALGSRYDEKAKRRYEDSKKDLTKNFQTYKELKAKWNDLKIDISQVERKAEDKKDFKDEKIKIEKLKNDINNMQQQLDKLQSYIDKGYSEDNSWGSYNYYKQQLDTYNKEYEDVDKQLTDLKDKVHSKQHKPELEALNNEPNDEYKIYDYIYSDDLNDMYGSKDDIIQEYKNLMGDDLEGMTEDEISKAAESYKRDELDYNWNVVKEISDSLNGDFIVKGTRGLWNGVKAGAYVESNSLFYIIYNLSKSADSLSLGFNRAGNFILKCINHDGTNKFIIKKLNYSGTKVWQDKANKEPNIDKETVDELMLDKNSDNINVNFNLK